MPTPISIALCSDERYVPGLLVTAASILIHTSQEQPLEFFILDTGITDNSWRRLEKLVRKYSPASTLVRLKPDLSVFQGCPTLGGSHATYARLLLPELTARDRILYFDVDMLVLKDVRMLRDLPWQAHTAMAVYENGNTLSKDCAWLASADPDRQLPYFNAGVMVLNLAAWRSHGHTARALDLVRDHGQQMLTYDQTVLNYLLRHETGALDPSWNLFCIGNTPDAAYLNPEGVVVHITHNKPWQTFKNLPGALLWLVFYDRFVGGRPAMLHFGIVWKTRKWANLRSVLRILLEGFMLKTTPTARLLLFWLARCPTQAVKAHWLRRWLDRGTARGSGCAERGSD